MATTDAQVRAIIELDAAFDTSPFIEAAGQLLADAMALKNSVYSDAKKLLIETWLAAHFCAVLDPRTIMESAGSVSERYEGHTSLALNFTRYGQQAMLLDTDGGLSAINGLVTADRSVVKVGITWLGKSTEEARAY